MKKTFAIATIILFTVSCSDVGLEYEQNERTNIVLTKSGKAISSDMNKFALEFMSDLASEEKGNIFISPFSIQTALAMAENGAEGNTREQIKTALLSEYFSEEEINEYFSIMLSSIQEADNSTTMHLANSFWTRDDIEYKTPYAELLESCFKAHTKNLSNDGAASAREINNWVSNNTGGNIRDMVKSADGISFMLLNALYFESRWSSKFEASMTKKGLFYGDAGTQTVKYMHKKFDSYQVEAYIGNSFAAISLPYGNQSFSMRVILPSNESDIVSVLSAMSMSTWNSMWGHATLATINFAMPKFDTEYSANPEVIKKLLRQRGIVDAFCEMADFSNITDQKLWIDYIQHKSKITVDESGAKATAATNIEMGNMTYIGSNSSIEMLINVDRPFAYFITENSTGAILFAGVQREF